MLKLDGRLRRILGKFKPRFEPTIGLYVSSLTLIMFIWLLIATPYGNIHFQASQYRQGDLDGSIRLYLDDRLVYSDNNLRIDASYNDFVLCKVYNNSNSCQAVGLVSTIQNKGISAFGLSTHSEVANTCEGLILDHSLDPILIEGSHEQNTNVISFNGFWIAQGDQAGISQLFLMVYNGDTNQVETSCYLKVIFDPIDIVKYQSLTVELDLLLR